MIERPKTVGAAVGIVCGLVQGLGLPTSVDPELMDGFAESGPMLMFFALVFPPILIGITQYGRRPPPLWEKISRYLDLYQFMIWGLLSSAAFGLFALSGSSESNPEALTLCGVFAAAGVGFFIGSLVGFRVSAGDS